MVVGSLCMCTALAVMAMNLAGRGGLTQPAVLPNNPAPVETSDLAIEAVPTATVVATDAPQPAEPTPPPRATATSDSAGAGENARRFADDFSNPQSGWRQASDADHTMDYFQDTYIMVLMIPNKMAVAVPPYAFDAPGDMIIGARLKGSGGNGFYGLMCHRLDPKNYYRISFRGNQFAIDKVIDNRSVPLTKPFWQEIIDYQPDADGMVSVNLTCAEGRIQLVVDGTGQAILTDTDYTGGDAALFVNAADKPGNGRIYMEATFDDVSVELP